MTCLYCGARRIFRAPPPAFAPDVFCSDACAAASYATGVAEFARLAPPRSAFVAVVAVERLDAWADDYHASHPTQLPHANSGA